MSSTLLPHSTTISNEAPISSVAKSLNADVSSAKDEEQGEEGFLQLILSKIMGKEQTSAASSVKENEELLEIDDKLLLKEATFVQILELLEKLGNSKKFGKFPNFNDKLNALLQDGATLEEFKNAKNLKDILNLSKKYGLGLEKISISTKDISQLEKTFPKLAKEGFFHPKKAIIASEMILRKSQKTHTQQTSSQEKGETSTLSKILKELENQKTTQPKTNEVVQNEKEDKTVDTAPKINSAIKEQIASLTKESTLNIQSKTTKNSSLAKEILQEQNVQESSKSDNVNLNSLKDIKNQTNIKTVDTKHTLNTFARDFKEQIEQYKPPLMKVQLALNPKNLGEMEVTIVNRGSNLHVNFTSNTQAMNLFIQNQAEFKNSLVNMGFTNLEMNFSDERKNQEQKRGNSNSNSNQETEEFDEFTKENTILNMVIPSYV